MPKQTISDINPSRRTIRDIPVPRRREAEHMSPPPPPPPPPPQNEMRRPRRRFPAKIAIFAIIIILAICGILLRELLRVHATVTVFQKQKDVSISGTFIAKKSAGDGELAFDTISATKEESQTVPATGQKQVETPASGTIVIYNNYSSAPQRLIKNTRFESKDGHIFRVNQSIVVPGKDKSGTPGSIEATVYADAAGADYNIGLSDFTIPGFKSDPRYSGFYGRSKTPMTGGFVGSIKTASQADLDKATKDLEATLTDELTKNIHSQVPQGSALFNSAVHVDFTVLSPADSNELKVGGTAYGLIFNEKKLSSSIASATVSDYDGSEVLGSNLGNITFTNIPADARPWETGTASFSLAGTTTLTWIFDSEKLKNDLAGQSKQKDRITTILKAYPSISRVDILVLPIWRSTLPDDTKQISVVLGKNTK